MARGRSEPYPAFAASVLLHAAVLAAALIAARYMTKPISNLPAVIFQFGLSAYDDWQRLAWVGALLIAAAVLTINIFVRIISQEPKRS